MLVGRWARPEELSWPFPHLKFLTIISPITRRTFGRNAEESRLSHEQMVIRFAEEENIRYSS